MRQTQMTRLVWVIAALLMTASLVFALIQR
jgi:hypothetical protein